MRPALDQGGTGRIVLTNFPDFLVRTVGTREDRAGRLRDARRFVPAFVGGRQGLHLRVARHRPRHEDERGPGPGTPLAAPRYKVRGLYIVLLDSTYSDALVTMVVHCAVQE